MNPPRPKRVSAVMITLNAEAVIRECLESVTFADEIIVVDSGSQDRTLDICRQYHAKIFQRAFQGYGAQKDFAVKQASGDWVFVIDADERVPVALREEIASVAVDPDAADGYLVARKNYVGDKWIQFGGWYPDYSVRLFRRGKGRFNARAVHESAQVEGRVEILKHPMIHRTCRDFEEFERRQMRYAELASGQMAQEGKSAAIWDLWLRPPMAFLKMYLLKGGFLDGEEGWKLARLYARYTQMKYALLRQLRR
jgi:glycosyltransferase involved in cell wall biosynthesis